MAPFPVHLPGSSPEGGMSAQVWAFLSGLFPEDSAIDSNHMHNQIRSPAGTTALTLICSYQIPNFVFKGVFKNGILSEIWQFHLGIDCLYMF